MKDSPVPPPVTPEESQFSVQRKEDDGKVYCIRHEATSQQLRLYAKLYTDQVTR